MRRSPFAAVLIAVALVVVTMEVTSGWLGIVTTRGVSMEPTFSQGDLVVTRRTGNYRTGDIIAYRSQQLGDEVVLHRVIDRRGDHHLTQGDNNDWVDADRPTEDDIVGEVWFHLPGAGRIATPLRSIGPVVAVAALFSFSIAFSSRSERSATARRKPAMSVPIPAQFLSPSTKPWLVAAFAASAMLALAGFLGPISRLEPTTAEIRHVGAFSYEASAERSIVYPDRSIDTGDPIFRSATDELNVGYEHEARPPARTALEGASLSGGVVIRIGSWEHRLRSIPPVPFEGDRATLETAIGLDEVQTVIDGYRSVSGQAALQAVVLVEVEVRADVAGDVRSDVTEFDTSLALAFAPDSIGISQDQLQVRTGDPVDQLIEAPRRIEALGRSITAAHARWAGLAGASCAAALLAATMILQRRGPESAPILAVARDRLVPVDLIHATDAVSVLDRRAFVRIATETDALVLHSVDDDGNETFVIDDGRRRYRYSTGTPERARRSA